MIEVGRDFCLVRLCYLVELAAKEEVKPCHLLASQEALLSLLSNLIVVATEELRLQVRPVLLESPHRSRVGELSSLLLVDLFQSSATNELGCFAPHILEERRRHSLENLALGVLFRLKDLACLWFSLHNPLEEKLTLRQNLSIVLNQSGNVALRANIRELFLHILPLEGVFVEEIEFNFSML